MADTTGIKQTPNIGLYQPDYANIADIQVLNENFGKLDDLRVSSHILFVSTSATETGDGTEAKPFKTIGEAVETAKKYSGYIRVNISAGNYAEDIDIKDAPNSAYHLIKYGTGTVQLKTIKATAVSNMAVEGISFRGGSRASIQYTDVSRGAVVSCSCDGIGTDFYNSSVFITGLTVTNAEVAIGAKDNSIVSIRGANGDGNTYGIYATESHVSAGEYTLTATYPATRINGGMITIEGQGTDLAPLSLVSGGTGSSIQRESLKNLHALGVYARSDLGDTVNVDNPPYNGLFEIRIPEATYTGDLPYDRNYYPLLSMKTPDNIAMLQIAGGDGFYIRGAQKNGVTMDGVPWSKIITDDDTSRILVSGSRGVLSGYETRGTSNNITANSPDSNETGSAITVSNGTAGTSWTKIVRVTSAVTVTLGTSWKWQSGFAPTIKEGGILLLCWCGSGGIAVFVSP